MDSLGRCAGCLGLGAALVGLWLGSASAAPSSGMASAFAGAAPPADGDAGFLDIASDPPARIQVDGADTGQVTPQPHLSLPVGHHTLTLVTLDGKRTRTLGFQIERGKATRLSLHLGG